MTITTSTTADLPKRTQPSPSRRRAGIVSASDHNARGAASSELTDQCAPVNPAGLVGELDSSPSGAEVSAPTPKVIRAAGEPSASPTTELRSEPTTQPSSGWLELRVWAECFDDTQKARIACANRMLRGGIHPDLFVSQIGALEAAEHEVALGLRRCYRRVVPAPIIAWQRETRGVGEHMLARLLGALGHPVLAQPYHWTGEGSERELIADPPFERTVAQLWSYCGVGDATRKRRKGMSADEAMALGNPRCKMLVRLLAEASMKSRGPHREHYDAGRELYLERSDWTDGHRHAAALRLTGKAMLADLWAVAA